jgi:predicted RNase H-like HicB family nuclease
VYLKAAEEGGFVVTFLQVPEAQGDNEGEALATAVDALETALSFYIDAGCDLPQAGKGRRTVRPFASLLTAQGRTGRLDRSCPRLYPSRSIGGEGSVSGPLL